MKRISLSHMSALALVLSLANASRIRADEPNAMEAWAQWATAPRVWKGQTIAAPAPTPRPTGKFVRLDSQMSPLHVHVSGRSGWRQAEAYLRIAEEAYAVLRERSWPVPPPDGGYGGTLGFDLYFADVAGCDGACARIDAPLGVTDFDAAETYAIVQTGMPIAELRACVQSAIAQAGLRSVDPAEAESWLRATGDLNAWLTTGEAGCDDSFSLAQQAPERSVLDDDPQSAGAGGLLLAMLEERTDGANGDFVRSLWESTRQRSQGLVPIDRLRSSPDLWEVLAQTLSQTHVRLADELTEFGVARYFAGQSRRRAQATYRVLGSLPSDAATPLAADLAITELPTHVHGDRPLASLGSAYVRVRTAADVSRPQLQVWLRGELGPRWSLTALRLAADGRELGRTSAPARNVPSSYLPIVLDGETTEVILVVTNLPDHTPDADAPAPSAHGYELILARGD